MSLSGLIGILLVIGASIVAGAIQKRFLRLQSVMRGLLVSYVTIMLILSAGELYFRYAFAESGWSFTRAGENWDKWYVDNNSLGFRDREWSPEDYAGKTTVILLGDSLTQGFGIENVEDRFGNVLANLLGPEYAVLNLGVVDSSTRDQLEILRSYPLKDPDIVIWQYFLNDINDAGLSIGDYWLPQLPRHRPQWVEESYLANFIYWRLAPHFTTVDATDYRSYWEWAYYAYDNYGIWTIHRQEITDLVEYVNSIGARLIVVVFPNLEQPQESIPYVDRVTQLLDEQGEDEYLALYDDVSYFVSELGQEVVVSRRDFHPNAMFNRHLGQKLYDTFFAPQ
jgi:hypothetical protein